MVCGYRAVSDEFKSKGMIMSISTEEIKGANIAGVRVVNAGSLTRSFLLRFYHYLPLTLDMDLNSRFHQ